MKNKFLPIFSLLCFAFLWACSSVGKSNEKIISEDGESTATITILGTFKNLQKGTIKLEKFENNSYKKIDSVEVKGDKFKMQVPVNEADFYRLIVFNKKIIPLVLSDKQLEIKIELDAQQAEITYKVIGSKDSDYYRNLNDYLSNLRKKETSLTESYQNAKTDEERIKIQEEYLNMFKVSASQVKVMIDSIAPSIVALTASSFLISPDGQMSDEDYEYLFKLTQKFKKELPNSRYSKKFAEQIDKFTQEREKIKHLAVGKPAPEIELQSPEGKNIKLSSLKGKLVLIDFWASWCGPCRKENPNVVRVYNQYKSKGFEIFGVSLDKDRAAWLKAIEQDQLTWLHVSDLKYWQSAAAQTYLVQAIPQTYLIGKDGNILAKNLRGKALENKIAEILK